MNNEILPENANKVDLPLPDNTTLDTPIPPDDNTQTSLLPVERIAALFAHGQHGHAVLPTNVSVALRRLDTNRPTRSIGSVITTLVTAGIRVETISDDEITRWAAVIHAIALLSGASGRGVHRRCRVAGRTIADAGYSSTRFARLLTAKGEALPPQVVRLARFLSNAPRAIPLDLRPIAELLLWDGRNSERADSARMTLARGYYASATGR